MQSTVLGAAALGGASGASEGDASLPSYEVAVEASSSCEVADEAAKAAEAVGGAPGCDTCAKTASTSGE